PVLLSPRVAARRQHPVAQPRQRLPLPARKRHALPRLRSARRANDAAWPDGRALLSFHGRHRHFVRRSKGEMSEHLLVRAARGEAVERPPVWAMRQAGRWDPEFNKIRAGLSFYEFSENVELAAKASLCPKRFGVDAIILFYDITTLPVAM